MPHPGSCAAGCRYWTPTRAGGNCEHPKREDHWRVPMLANCWWHNHDVPPIGEAAPDPDGEGETGEGQLALTFPRTYRRRAKR